MWQEFGEIVNSCSTILLIIEPKQVATPESCWLVGCAGKDDNLWSKSDATGSTTVIAREALLFVQSVVSGGGDFVDLKRMLFEPRRGRRSGRSEDMGTRLGGGR
jgi:hypothetical protein